LQPARTLYLAFGHDEEVGGETGARVVAERFIEMNERLEFVVDEGGAITVGVIKGQRFIAILVPCSVWFQNSDLFVVSKGPTRPVAAIGVVEKGYLSLELTVDDPSLSGHSSMPPSETVIGVLSSAVVKLEASKFPVGLHPASVQTLESLAPDVPFGQRLIMANMWLLQPLIEQVLARGSATDQGMVGLLCYVVVLFFSRRARPC
jgi:carboxypeptidase PM20D1